MKYRAIVLAAGLLAAHSAANAVFFFIPTGAIINAVQGGHCVRSTAKAGDTFKSVTDGRMYVVTETNGTSSRCANPEYPVIAKAAPYFTEAELREQHSACLPQGTGVGTTTTLPELGEVQVVSVDTAGCSDMAKPVSAKVVRVQAVQSRETAKLPDAPLTYGGRPVRAREPDPPKENLACVPLGAGPDDRVNDAERGSLRIVRVLRQDHQCGYDNPLLAEVRQADPEPAKPTPVVDQQQPLKRSIADRLRELKQLRDENLITQDVYEAKQKDILSGQ